MNLNLEKELNTKQLEAARQLEGPLLIIAGAGSGKTRMITFRMAYMLSQGIAQSAILALTFTNKAAREMAQRTRQLTQKRLSNLTVSTFHAFGVKILRKEIHHLGFKENFSIYDGTDKIALIKEIAREIDLSLDSINPFDLANLFSAVKTGRQSFKSLEPLEARFYEEYLDHLKAYNAVDFDDLIILPIKIFNDFPQVLSIYHNRFKYIMVDEFQDTSMAQYQLMHLLARKSRNVCVVGDDDQSIYSWRGANYENILNFERDYPGLNEIKLEQNYRSTKNILEAANQLISNNKNRKTKQLWTGIGDGKAIELFFPNSETREAQFIAEMIQSLNIQEGIKYQEVGILVRTNGLTTPIEEALLTENIPYKVTGGKSFFQRKEIKDIIAYLRVVSNPDDDVNLLRIINTPRRGIGKKTLFHIRALAEQKKCSLYSALSALRWAEDSPLKPGLKQNLEEFITLLEYYREQLLSGKQLAQKVKGLVDAVGYWGHLIQEFQDNEKAARWKFGNITKFIEMMERWEKDPDNLDPNLFSYLNRISLITRNDNENEDEQGMINLMTIHAAKGLEFELVFLAGVEDKIIPHARSLEENPENVEEERRLFYVAITRAKKKLYMTSCRTRMQMRKMTESAPSPFLSELPEHLIEFHNPEQAVASPDAANYFDQIKAQWS